MPNKYYIENYTNEAQASLNSKINSFYLNDSNF